ncbi:MAG: hypothetical protein R3B96_21530 [Pirellulaceae bacterium]
MSQSDSGLPQELARSLRTGGVDRSRGIAGHRRSHVVLAMGLYGLRWSSFFGVRGAANAVLSLVYAAVGSWASEQGCCRLPWGSSPHSR